MEALLLIDIQNDYFPGGKMELHKPLEAAQAAQALLKEFRERKLPVVHVQHISQRPGANFFLPGTDGAEIHELVRPIEGEHLVVKGFPNSFRDTGLDLLLKSLGADSLCVCGMMTHMCIDTSVRAAFDLGWKLELATAATATRELQANGVIVPAEHVQAAYIAALSQVFCKLRKTS